MHSNDVLAVCQAQRLLRARAAGGDESTPRPHRVRDGWCRRTSACPWTSRCGYCADLRPGQRCRRAAEPPVPRASRTRSSTPLPHQDAAASAKLFGGLVLDGLRHRQDRCPVARPRVPGQGRGTAGVCPAPPRLPGTPPGGTPHSEKAGTRSPVPAVAVPVSAGAFLRLRPSFQGLVGGLTGCVGLLGAAFFLRVDIPLFRLPFQRRRWLACFSGTAHGCLLHVSVETWRVPGRMARNGHERSGAVTPDRR